MDSDRLLKICLVEWISMAQSTSLISQFTKVTSQHGFSTQYLLSTTLQRTFLSRVLDTSMQTDSELLAKNKFLNWLTENKTIFQVKKYLPMSLTQFLRRTYSSTRFKLWDSMPNMSSLITCHIMRGCAYVVP